MPEEISGQKNSNVVCQGRVMRFKDAPVAERHRCPGEWGAGGFDCGLQVYSLGGVRALDASRDSRPDPSTSLRAGCRRY